jgi:hypothetical protein
MIVANSPKLTKLVDVAAMIGVPAYALRADVKAMLLPCRRLGGRLYVDVEAHLAAYLERASDRAREPAPRRARTKAPTRTSEAPAEPKAPAQDSRNQHSHT